MAKGNMFLGMSRGSVGDVTFYRSRGNQIARARNRKPNNPKTDAQVIQRAILATASKAYARMKGIVDHSFQGIAYGGISQSYFLKRAMEDIRNFVAVTYPEFPESMRNDPRAFVGLAEPTNSALAGVGLLISQGTIPSVPVVLNTPAQGEEPTVSYFGKNITQLEDTPVSTVLDALGAQVGDQITAVAIEDNGTFNFSRFIVKADATAADLAKTWDDELAKLSQGQESIFDAKSQINGGLTINVDAVGGMTIGNEQTNTPPQAGAIIISRKDGDVWQRSTQRLVWLSDAGDFSPNFADNVIPMWMAGTAVIETENPYYLNNAEE